ncbi:hypothetical protein J2W42_006230 [Rhizobium tibeticum]|nr:hypothetical protein [Rhizobium tibeticum]
MAYFAFLLVVASAWNSVKPMLHFYREVGQESLIQVKAGAFGVLLIRVTFR